MSVGSPLLVALRAANPAVPEALARFDAAVRAGACGPSFEEYSARVGDDLSAWRETMYFDLAAPPAGEVADARLFAAAEAVGVGLPPRFAAYLRARASLAPEVLQIVLGYDAGGGAAPPRLKYYLIFRADSAAAVERLREAVGAPPLPPALDPSTVYIVGVDLCAGGLFDFKIYVRLAPARVPAAIRNLRGVAELWRGCRYLVYQRCLVGGGEQVYFHAASADLLERELVRRAWRQPAAAALRGQVAAMNRATTTRWRPWILSLPFAGGRLGDAPANVYFHPSHPADDV
ncbi:MAG: hypothetical protein R3A79_30620 [Nannocystaceae bacterium]